MCKQLVFDYIVIAVLISVFAIFQPQHTAGLAVLGVLFGIIVTITRYIESKE